MMPSNPKLCGLREENMKKIECEGVGDNDGFFELEVRANPIKSDLLYGDFTPTEKYHRIYDIAKQYHEETEAYDQAVCRAKNERGVAIPTDAYELRLINSNALKVRNRLLNENPDIDQRELYKVIRRFPN